MYAKTTRTCFAVCVRIFQLACACFDGSRRSLLCTSPRERVESLERWRTDVDVDGGSIVKICEKGAFADVVLAAFFGAACDHESDEQRREASHVSWASWSAL